MWVIPMKDAADQGASSSFLGSGSMVRTNSAESDILSIIHLLLTEGDSAKILASDAIYAFSASRIGYGSCPLRLKHATVGAQI